jgi:hypothetical protein
VNSYADFIADRKFISSPEIGSVGTSTITTLAKSRRNNMSYSRKNLSGILFCVILFNFWEVIAVKRLYRVEMLQYPVDNLEMNDNPAFSITR